METAYLPLGCYGKLPFWPEYLEHRAGLPTGQVFRRWLHEGRMEAGLDTATEEAAGRVRETLSRRFLLAAPRSMELQAGVIRPSTDRGALRGFPFATFVHLSRRPWARSFALLPLALAPVWEALEDAWDNLAACSDPAAFETVRESFRIPAPEPPRRVRAEYEAALREDAAGLGGPDGGVTLDALRAELPPLVARIRQAGEEDSVAAELPVSRDLREACFDAAFWIDLMDRQFWWHRAEPMVFLDAAPGAADRRVIFVIGSLRPGLYPVVMGTGEDTGVLLRPPLRPAATESGAVPSYRELLRARLG